MGRRGTVSDVIQASIPIFFACAHTCLPVVKLVRLPEGLGLIDNNGAAGMPNFHVTRYGVVTRIATRPWDGVALYSACVEGIYVEALPLRYDHARWERYFLANWPPGTAARESYWQRILHGPDFHPAQAVESLRHRSGYFHG